MQALPHCTVVTFSPAHVCVLVLLLHRVTEKGNYTELDAAHIIQQILQGVQYLHSHGEWCCSWECARLAAEASVGLPAEVGAGGAP